MIRVTKEIREEAILRASAAACTPEVIGRQQERETCDWLGISGASQDLYWAAWRHVMRSEAYLDADATDPVLDAEAEALLRTGWSP